LKAVSNVSLQVKQALRHSLAALRSFGVLKPFSQATAFKLGFGWAASLTSNDDVQLDTLPTTSASRNSSTYIHQLAIAVVPKCKVNIAVPTRTWATESRLGWGCARSQSRAPIYTGSQRNENLRNN